MTNTYNETKRHSSRRMRSRFSTVCTVMLAMVCASKAQAQTFFYGPANVAICHDAAATSLDMQMTLLGTNPSATLLTWNPGQLPQHGVLQGVANSFSTMGLVTPSGLTYTPSAGYVGTDTFSIIGSDGTTANTNFGYVTVTAAGMVSVSTPATVCMGSTTAALYTSTASVYNYTGGMQTFTVPAGVTSVDFDVQGARGGNDDNSADPNPGKGGRVVGTLAVTPGQVLNIFVGDTGSRGGSGIAAYNGGGISHSNGGGGGGATDIRIGGLALANRVVVAGGGGGNGNDLPYIIAGGDGGNVIGGTSAPGSNPSIQSSATGGTQSSGGAGGTYTGYSSGFAGGLGFGGDGSNVSFSGSGAGGGGYYGGGGGIWAGGGGGSSYTDPVLVTGFTHTQGYNSAQGIVTITYVSSNTYSLVWDGAATTAGFTNVTAAAVTNPINIDVPATAPAGNYNATFTTDNGTCTSLPQTVTVTVLPTPAPISGSATICHGSFTTYTNDSTGGEWSSSDATIVAINTATGVALGRAAGVATISYKLGSGCAVTYTVTVNEIPSVSLTNSHPEVCFGTSSADIAYTALTNATAGTDTFNITWSSAALTAGFNNVMAGVIPASPFTIAIPATATADVYNGTLTIANANGCLAAYGVSITVKPVPVLTSPLSAEVCDSTPLAYIFTSTLAGTSYSWSRDAVAGISNPAASGSGDIINDTLKNITVNPVVVTYIDTLTLNGCVNIQAVTVTVNPTPVLSSIAPASICNNTLYSNVFASATPGVTHTWVREAIVGIDNPAANGTDSVHEVLSNSTTNQVLVTYTDTLTIAANGCMNVQQVTVTVNPTPQLSTPLTAADICDSTLFSYEPASSTTGTPVAIAWTRATVTGISNPAATGIGNPNEILVNTTNTSLLVPYTYTLTIDGCSNSQQVSVIVNPKPILNLPTTPIAVCDSALISYLPTTPTSGTATYAWSRAFVAGISALGASGVNSINEYLKNSTDVSIAVAYVYTVTINGCTNTQTVNAVVRPTPTLSGSTTGAHICNGYQFTYVPASNTPGATFTWTRAAVAGILPTSDTGIGNINESLNNTTTGVLTVTYVYTINTNGCTNQQSIAVTVDAALAGTTITTKPESVLCTQSHYVNFGAAATPDSTFTYEWSATNAVIFATGADKQYSIVNFENTGDAVVTLSTHNIVSGCTTTSSDTVHLGLGTSDSVYVTYSHGQLVCLRNDVTSYQWGYDDHSTLDSTIIVGAIDQSYTVSSAEFTSKYFWVMTTQNGCTKKQYYNAPTAVNNVNEEMVTDIKVYPNPASDHVIVELTSVTGDVQVEVLNMLGQKVAVAKADGGKVQINTAGLASGMYMVDCISNGVKTATAKFIKN